MTEDINVAKLELTKEILKELGITEHIHVKHMMALKTGSEPNPDMAIEKYSECFKKLYKVMHQPG